LDSFPGDTLHDKIGRAVCRASCLPRKEFFESWAVAKRVRRRVSGRPILEIAAGHGLLSYMLLLLDKTAGPAVCVDRRKPLSTERLDAVLCEAWPRLKGQVTYQEADAKDVTVEPGALVVSAHGCGRLTDTVLNMAIAARSPVAVLPCCQSLRLCDTGGLEAWMEGRLAIDAIRAIRLRTAGYTIRAQTIPAEITPQNRLLIGLPNSPAPST
jgi:hypothetical protein